MSSPSPTYQPTADTPRSARTRIGIAASTALLLAGGVLVAAPAADARIQAATGFGGSAYGSAGRVGSDYSSGRTALVPLCTSKPGVTHVDHTQKSSNSKVGLIGAVHTSVSSVHTAGGIASVSKARTAVTSLFGSAVTGTAFAVTAKASRTSSGYSLSGSTTLVDVKIAGRSVPQHPAVNQTMSLPGLGKVVLNKQTRSHRFGLDQITVIAMQITLNGNSALGLPKGTLVISSARASLHEPTHHRASGNAYGSTVASGDEIQSGKTAPVYLPCGGSNGVTRHNSTATDASAPLQSATTHTTARSTDTAHATTATLTSTVQGVSLLGGVIRAKAIVGKAVAKRTNGHLTRSSAGTSILGLTINGKSQSGTEPANTKYSIPGIGTLWVHRVVKTATGLHVYALQLVLGADRAGLTKGAVITIAGASAAVSKR